MTMPLLSSIEPAGRLLGEALYRGGLRAANDACTFARMSAASSGVNGKLKT